MKLKYELIEENMLRMHTLANELKDILDYVSTEMKKLNSTDVWRGNGAEYVEDNFNKVKTHFNPIYEELEKSIFFITDVTEGYKYLDKRITDEILNNLDIPEPNYDDSRIFVSKSLDKKTNNE